MTPKASTEAIEHAIRDYVAGESIQVVAARHHVSTRRVAAALRERGLHRSRPLPVDEIAARYQAGESKKALARAFGVSHQAITHRLKLAGVAQRSTTEATREAMRRWVSRADEAQRAQWAEHGRATLGANSQTLAQKHRNAQARQVRGLGVSADEAQLHEWLMARGIDPIPKCAVGPYNVDLGIDPVAVEIFPRVWRKYGRHKKRTENRYRTILDQGWSVIVVWVDKRHHPLTEAAAEYVTSFVETVRRDRSLRGRYWVIWGDGEEIATNGADLEELIRVPRLR